MRTIATALALATFGLPAATPAAAFDIGDLSDSERTAFRAEIRDYLIENPEVLVEAIGVLEERQAQAQAGGDRTLVRTNADAIFDDGHSWVGGNPEGDVTMVEFLDYACSFCKQAHPEVSEMLDADGDIRFIVKEFPILGPGSEVASRFAIAVLQTAGDAAYAEVHDRLMRMRGGLSEAAVERLADELGLDMAELRTTMDSDAVSAVIAENRALADRLRITGTPTFILGDRMLRGYMPRDAMEGLVEIVRND